MTATEFLAALDALGLLSQMKRITPENVDPEDIRLAESEPWRKYYFDKYLYFTGCKKDPEMEFKLELDYFPRDIYDCIDIMEVLAKVCGVDLATPTEPADETR